MAAVGLDVRDYMPGKSLRERVVASLGIFDDFCSAAIDRILGGNARLVGFSSCFSDRLFCVHMIRCLKKANPSLTTVVGGPNCDGAMGDELFRLFPEIDYVVQGYADRTFVDLVMSHAANARLGKAIQGVLSREYPKTSERVSAILTQEQYENLPDPDFTDYFSQVRQALNARGLLRRRSGREQWIGTWRKARPGMSYFRIRRALPRIVMETCRGCWWADRRGGQRCTFCGDEQACQGHLQKSSAIALAQFQRLVKQYDPAVIYLTDRLANPSLGTGFWDVLAPDGGDRPEVWTEASGSTSRKQLAAMAKGGARFVQTGIESLDDSELRAMEKPTDVLSSIATMRSFADFGIYMEWGIVGPMPGSKAPDPAGVAAMTHRLVHLQPAPWVRCISIYRSSKLQTNPELFGLSHLNVPKALRALYILPDESLRQLCHEFEAEGIVQQQPQILQAALDFWTRVYPHSHLLYIGRTSGAWIIDTRPCRTSFFHRLDRQAARVYEFCSSPKRRTSICAQLQMDETDVQPILTQCVDRHTMLLHKGRYLSLAVEPTTNYRRYRPTPPTEPFLDFPIRDILAWRRGLDLPSRYLLPIMLAVVFSWCVTVFGDLRWRFMNGSWMISRLAVAFRQRLWNRSANP